MAIRTFLQNIPFIFVATGILFLFLAFFPARKAYLATQSDMKKGWRFLGGLILFFLGAYALYMSHMTFAVLRPDTLLVATIMLAGSIFVLVCAHAGLRSTQHLSTLLQQEEYRSLHDKLTELPNRTLLQDRIDQAILHAKREKEPFAILLVDLHHFREINEALGYSYGDYLLRQIAGRFRRAVRASDTLARFGGDEFAIILPGASIEQAISVSHKIAGSLEETFSIKGQNITICINTGIVVYPEHGIDGETLLKHANIAAGEAKRNDVTYAVFDPKSNPSSWGKLILIGDLRKALSGKQLFLHYQPKVSSHDGFVSGVEALIRWRHPVHGFIGPDEFIPLAEQAGLMKPLTRWVLEKAVEQNRHWRDLGFCLPVAINLSVKNLHDLEFPDDLIAILDRQQADPSFLKLEITESTMMADPNRVNTVITRLNNIGFPLSIDDYGTGYSSLSYLRKFPATEIKIDKSFILDMLTNEDNAVIVRSTIDMVHNIGRKVVAEGVENIETLKLLHDLGCDFLQGYYIAHPLPAEDFLQWLQKCPWKIKLVLESGKCDSIMT